MILISNASEDDLDEIYRIEVNSFEKPYPYSLLRAYLVLADGLYLTAKYDGKIVGYVIGIIQNGYRGHIVSIAVDKLYRKRGIGSTLLKSIEEKFKMRSAKYSYLEVDIRNHDAISLYWKNGYISTYLRRNYYGRGKHALVMVKNLYNITID